MPPTRRPTSQHGPMKRKITRRRSRKSTWMDLLDARNARISDTMYTQTAASSLNHPCRIASLSSGTEPLAPQSIPERGHALVDGEEDSYHNCDHVPNPLKPIEDSNHAPEADIYSALSENDDENSDEVFEGTGEDYNPQDEGEVMAAAENFKELFSNHKAMLSPSNLIALTLLCGSVKFSVKQYGMVRAILKYATDTFELPSYSTVQRYLLPHLLRNCFPHSTMASFPKTRPRREHMNEMEGDTPTAEANQRLTSPTTRIVLPTEWARMDVSSLPYFENIFGDGKGGAPKEASFRIEDSWVVCNRDPFINVSRYLFVEDKYGKRPAAAGDEIAFQLRGIPDRFSMSELEGYSASHSEGALRVSAIVIATWCVGTEPNETESGKAALRETPVSFQPILLGMINASTANEETPTDARSCNSRTVRRFFTEKRDTMHGVIPGDICSLISSNAHVTLFGHTPRLCGIFVSRSLKRYEGMPSQFLIWIRLNNGGTSDKPYDVLDVQNVVALPRLIRTRHQLYSKRDSKNIGLLKDGRPYVTYRVLLYCDDFKESGSQYSQASCGGVYLLPIGMTQKARRSRTAVHVISLTPPGVSTNEVLLNIIPDLVKGATGIQGVLPSGEPVQIFIDVVGFIADYPAAAEPLDILGHTADTPCTHCGIRKFKNSGRSAMGFTTDVHASNSASLRCAERHNALRMANLTNRETNVLGMKTNEAALARAYPLSVLRNELWTVRSQIPVTSQNVPVITGLFDPFRSSVVAPDHLLSGLARNIIDLCFRVLRPDIRKDLDIAICSAMQDNGLPRQKSIYNVKKIQLHSMSLSSVFCVLLTFEPVYTGFSSTESDIIGEAVQLLEWLKDLIAMTFWNPTVDTDGEEAHRMMREEGGRPYHSFLQGLAERYVRGVDEFCSAQSELGLILDKPNLHRLLELYHHTIPMFGHASLIQELVFETAHQPLKRSISGGNHKAAEASAVRRCLGNDWQARLGMLYEKMHTDDTRERMAAYNGIGRLLLGRDFLRFHSSMNGNQLENIHQELESCFVAPLLNVLRSNGNANPALTGKEARWTTNCEYSPPQDDVGTAMALRLETVMRKARNTFHIVKGSFAKTENDLEIRWKAKRVRPSSEIGHAPVRPHEVLKYGSVIQALTNESDGGNLLVRPPGRGDHAVHIFLVVGFIHGDPDGPWAACTRCEESGKDRIAIPKDFETTNIQMIQLNDGVRRIGVYHVCRYGESCKIERLSRSVIHSDTTLSGGLFRTQRRCQGYPPRLA